MKEKVEEERETNEQLSKCMQQVCDATKTGTTFEPDYAYLWVIVERGLTDSLATPKFGEDPTTLQRAALESLRGMSTESGAYTLSMKVGRLLLSLGARRLTTPTIPCAPRVLDVCTGGSRAPLPLKPTQPSVPIPVAE